MSSEATDFAGFEKAQTTLNTNYGLFNTCILLTSSWLSAFAVQAAKRGARKPASRGALAAALCGIAFLAIKATEYSHEFEEGHFLTTNNFFMYYFVVTFLHSLHVLAGIVILFVLSSQYNDEKRVLIDIKWLESAGTFWHAVDLLWVIIFALFYLVSW